MRSDAVLNCPLSDRPKQAAEAITHRVCNGQSFRGRNMESPDPAVPFDALITCPYVDWSFQNWHQCLGMGLPVPCPRPLQCKSAVSFVIKRRGRLSALPDLHESLVFRFYSVLVAAAQSCTPS